MSGKDKKIFKQRQFADLCSGGYILEEVSRLGGAEHSNINFLGSF